MKMKTFLLDFDGTLVDSMPAYISLRICPVPTKQEIDKAIEILKSVDCNVVAD